MADPAPAAAPAIPSAVRDLLTGATQPIVAPLERGVRSAVEEFLDQRVRPELERTGQTLRQAVTGLAVVIGLAYVLTRRKDP